MGPTSKTLEVDHEQMGQMSLVMSTGKCCSDCFRLRLPVETLGLGVAEDNIAPGDSFLR